MPKYRLRVTGIKVIDATTPNGAVTIAHMTVPLMDKQIEVLGEAGQQSLDAHSVAVQKQITRMRR
jgi:hypothetical protein